MIIDNHTDQLAVKRSLNRELESIKVMLVHLHGQMNYTDWLAFVEKTKSGILKHPNQYLGNDYPDREVFENMIKLVFDEFIKDRQ